MRVLFGERIESKSETLTKTDAATATSPYSGFFTKRGGFKPWSIVANGA